MVQAWLLNSHSLAQVRNIHEDHQTRLYSLAAHCEELSNHCIYHTPTPNGSDEDAFDEDAAVAVGGGDGGS